MTQTTKHTCNDGDGPYFGRKTEGCPRCDELLAGAPAVQWAGSSARLADQQRAVEIRRHNCRASGCTVVCTFGDW